MMLKKIVLLSILSLTSAQDFFAADEDFSSPSSSDDDQAPKRTDDQDIIFQQWRAAHDIAMNWLALAKKIYLKIHEKPTENHRAWLE